MSDSNAAGFGKFVPGFDFLQNLAKGASASVPQMPNLGSWVAPTLNVEELDKRIEELKNVHFWLEQNSRALSATIQALEVQRMTLATLKGMNFNLADVAKAFTPKAAAPAAGAPPQASDKVADKPAEKEPEPATGASDGKGAATGSGLVDPLQLWGSLAQQFQQIAAGALQEVASKSAANLGKTMAATTSKTAAKPVAKKVAAKKTARKSPARKSTPK